MRRKHRGLVVILAVGPICGLLNRWLLVHRDEITAATTHRSFGVAIEKATIDHSYITNNATTTSGTILAESFLRPSSNRSSLGDLLTETETTTGTAENENAFAEFDESLDETTSFPWELLANHRVVSCGKDKCLFRSYAAASNSSEDEKDSQPVTADATGYLVSKPGKNLDTGIHDGWKIARYLETRFGIRHFLLSPPQPAILDPIEARDLFGSNASDSGGNETDCVGESSEGNATAASASIDTTVQKIRIMPQGSRELRLHHNRTEIRSRLEGLREQAAVERVDHGASPEFPFLSTLRAEVEETVRLLECEPLLALDFQIIADTRGRIHHLDFDRVLSQLGGLRRYNQTKFDAKVRSRIESASGLLETVREWIGEQERGGQTKSSSSSSNSPAVDGSGDTLWFDDCNKDWEADETAVLASRNLSCVATERVALARHTTTSTMAEPQSKNHAAVAAASTLETTEGLIRRSKHKRNPHGSDRLKHPLLVSLLQRVVEAGFYGRDARDDWGCNVYGDRVQ